MRSGVTLQRLDASTGAEEYTETTPPQPYAKHPPAGSHQTRPSVGSHQTRPSAGSHQTRPSAGSHQTRPSKSSADNPQISKDSAAPPALTRMDGLQSLDPRSREVTICSAREEGGPSDFQGLFLEHRKESGKNLKYSKEPYFKLHFAGRFFRCRNPGRLRAGQASGATQTSGNRIRCPHRSSTPCLAFMP